MRVPQFGQQHSDDIDEENDVDGDETEPRYFDNIVEVRLIVLVPAVVFVGTISLNEALVEPDKLNDGRPSCHQ